MSRVEDSVLEASILNQTHARSHTRKRLIKHATSHLVPLDPLCSQSNTRHMVGVKFHDFSRKDQKCLTKTKCDGGLETIILENLHLHVSTVAIEVRILHPYIKELEA